MNQWPSQEPLQKNGAAWFEGPFWWPVAMAFLAISSYLIYLIFASQG
jgi:hypothetical protein